MRTCKKFTGYSELMGNSVLKKILILNIEEV